jgi:hypothetical protein
MKNIRKPGNRFWPLCRALIALALTGIALLSGCGADKSDDHTSGIDLISNLPAGVVPVLGVTEIDLSPYIKIPLQAEQIKVSSVFRAGMDQAQLVQSGVGGFWHVDNPKKSSQVDWVDIALDKPRPVALLRVLPRRDNGILMWRGYKALLQVSNDGQKWNPVASLGIIPWPPDDVWLDFLVLVSENYSHYRLYIEDMDFLSMGRLELYQLKGISPTVPVIPTVAATPSLKGEAIRLPEAPRKVSGIQGLDSDAGLKKLTIDPATLRVSSALQEGMGGPALIREGTSGFWHLKTPRDEIPAWVSFSLSEGAPVRVLRVLPRTGLTDQLWNGPTAFLEASADGADWQVLAALEIDRDSLADDWISFDLNLAAGFGHYRLAIYDPSFLSLGRLELYAAAENAPATVTCDNVTTGKGP